MVFTNKNLEKIYIMSELTCEQCDNYSGVRDYFSSICNVTGEEIEDSGMVCNCGCFVKFEEE